MRIQLPVNAREIMHAVNADGGQALLVGGAVRDRVMAQICDTPFQSSKDSDIEVHRLSGDRLHRLLERFGRVDVVGMSFGVLKVTLQGGEQVDVALPRRESKAGSGHRGFDVQPDPFMTIKEAAARRDFTINSMAADWSGNVIDPFGGLADIRAGLLRATSERFADDPLRVLRGVQFASRFGFSFDAGTIDLAASLLPEFETLSAERVWGEVSKWLRGPHPDVGFDVLMQTGWIAAFPVLQAIVGVPQDPEWHPEGPVDVHTRLAIAEAARIASRERLDPEATEVLVLATLLHDIGKPDTTERNAQGRLTSHGHAELGSDLARVLLRGMRAPESVGDAVCALVREHMVHTGAQPTASTVRRLARRLAQAGTNVRVLTWVVEADASGRMAGHHSPMQPWAAVAERVQVADSGPSPILQGRHLIAAGMQPGPDFGPLLRRAFEAQIDGEFNDLAEALVWLATSRTESPDPSNTTPQQQK
jgi:tRNA nucleotidyltransferase (CCA-adding enzyme)